MYLSGEREDKSFLYPRMSANKYRRNDRIKATPVCNMLYEWFKNRLLTNVKPQGKRLLETGYSHYLNITIHKLLMSIYKKNVSLQWKDWAFIFLNKRSDLISPVMGKTNITFAEKYTSLGVT